MRNVDTFLLFFHSLLPPFCQAVIPHMAREYGFDYALITYKWPAWLHKQTEKQRLIWAYKILFLDVIFPLSLKKVGGTTGMERMHAKGWVGGWVIGNVTT